MAAQEREETRGVPGSQPSDAQSGTGGQSSTPVPTAPGSLPIALP
jgi:hypothetical protein